MRHHQKTAKLGMMTSHRRAFMRNMARNLLTHERIETTKARAKESRKLIEHLITLSKTDSLFSRRRAYDILSDRDLVMKLFKDIAPLFSARNSGYTRIIPLGFRRGDGADMVILELTERKIIEKLPKKKKEKAKTEEPKTEKAVEVKGDKAVEVKHKEDVKKEELRTKPIPKFRPTFAEEKRTEKAKSEDKKAASHPSFMKNLRGLFRKRGDR
ncbi:MAG: 50S ribosomal protein L17 [Omnitrophica bacterium RIFCSPLOWO2_02_FULL_45_16]|nr:MAG: 50S ribosomal protein L17 [Omnitrophica bacterium RIFCSPLOWO2_02_FULL_45_16]